MTVVPFVKDDHDHEEHVCCNMLKLQEQEKQIQEQEKRLEQLQHCLVEISYYINKLDTEDKRAINNIIIHNL